MENQTMETAKQILRQLGGRRFIMMVGAKHIGAIDNSLRFQFMRNTSGANRCTITINAMDTYDVTFYKIFKMQSIIIKEYNDVYCDQLQELFTAFTGLHTRLF